MRDDQRVLPDPGCYQERYRMTAGALPTVGASVAMIGLLFRGEALWAAGRDHRGGAGHLARPGAGRAAHDRVPGILHPDESGIVGTEGRVGRIEVRRRDQADAFTRTVSGWRLNRERLTAVTAAVAPGIPVIERPPAAPRPAVDGPVADPPGPASTGAG